MAVDGTSAPTILHRLQGPKFIIAHACTFVVVEKLLHLQARVITLDGVTLRSNDEYSSTLIIDRLEFVHRGNYTCTASNAAGSSSHTAELSVNGSISQYTIAACCKVIRVQ